MTREWIIRVCLIALLSLLAGCDAISPFIGNELKATICDRDRDGLQRSSEYCGGNDCDDVDRNVGEPAGWYRDVDGDTFGAGEAQSACTQPNGYVDLDGDCDDTDETVNPDVAEVCNGYDDNCDGNIDDENITVWYADVDLDTYGDPSVTLVQCDQPDGYVNDDTDCDDTDVTINPEGTEVCDDGIDQDCNGLTDDAEGSAAWYADTDGDGYGDEDEILYSCQAMVEGYVLDSTDCDDAAYDVSPAAFEACGDGIDNDCDGVIDTDAEDVPWYRDADEDGYGNTTDTQTDCAPPDGYVGNATDCDDTDDQVNPGVEEVCNNGVDDDCDESPGDCRFTGTLSAADADVVIEGTSSDDYTSNTLTSCDIDGDGVYDLVVAAYGSDLGGANTGSVFIFLSSSTLGSGSTAAADLTITGLDMDDAIGANMSCADIQGDGKADLFIDTVAEDEIYVFNGGSATGVKDTSQADMVIEGANASAIGTGDINGDGWMDIIVGDNTDDASSTDAGAVYLLYGDGSNFTGTINLSTADAKWTGEAANDYAAGAVAICDLNEDGIQDILVGAYGADAGGTEAGAVYLVYGGSHTGTINLSTANAKWTGEVAGDRAGIRLACGDTNGDGGDDLLINSPDAASAAGAVYLVYAGSYSGTASLSTADAKWTGEVAGDQAGSSLSLCDTDANGGQEILIGASGADTYRGAVYLVYGGSHTGTINLSTADAKWTGEAEYDRLGNTSHCSSDLNGDGFGDPTLGAIYADTGGENAGSVYVLYGLGY